MRTYSFYLYSDNSSVPVLSFETLHDDDDVTELATSRLNRSPRYAKIDVFRIGREGSDDLDLVFSLSRDGSASGALP
jgi:hypothetical protein